MPEKTHLPPHNKEAEMSVLGSCLRDDLILDVRTIVAPEDFYVFGHQQLFAGMLEIRRSGKRVDAATMGEWLKGKPHLHADISYPYLVELWDSAPNRFNVDGHAEIVRDNAMVRQLIHACNELQRDAYDHVMPPQELIQEAERRILGIGQQRSRVQTQTLGKVINAGADRIDERLRATEAGEHAATGIPAEFIDLDNLTGGWKDSELTIIGARPSVGKTALGLNLFFNAFKAGFPCLLFSLEMSHLELADRLICMESMVNSHGLRRGKLTGDEMRRVSEARATLEPWKSWISDTANITALQIFSEARRFKSSGLKMVIVDYLQLVEPENRRDQRYLQIGDISRRLKLMAKELSVPVIAMSQLNRDSDERRPRLSDLRESGDIEQNADNCILLHHPDKEAHMEVIVAKQRNGPIGELELFFNRATGRFFNAGNG